VAPAAVARSPLLEHQTLDAKGTLRAVEGDAAAKEGVATKAVWRSVAKLAMSLAVHRQGLWA
jgi:hypothetical protein